jgi:hypothetical protein
MGKTVNRQAQAKQELDRKLSLSAPTRELLEQLALACAKDPRSAGARFQYAFALSKSAEPSELRYAVTILDGLVSEGYEHQVDCMYGAATALYLLGDYEEARVRRSSTLDSPLEAFVRLTPLVSSTSVPRLPGTMRGDPAESAQHANCQGAASRGDRGRGGAAARTAQEGGGGERGRRCCDWRRGGNRLAHEKEVIHDRFLVIARSFV